MAETSVTQLFNRKDFSDRTALITSSQTFTYGEVAAQAERVAAGLWALGVRKGDRVCIYVSNSPPFMPLLYATWQIGAIAAFVDIYNPAPRLIAWCNFIEASCLVVDGARMEAVAPHLPALSTCNAIISTGAEATAPGVLPWSALADHRGPTPRVTVDGNDRLVIIQTSGTTAQPKGICHTLDSFNNRLASHLVCPPFSPDDVVCPMSPLSTVAGLNATSLPALALGGSVLLFTNAYDPASAFEQIAQQGGTIVMAGPPRIYGLTQAARSRPDLRTKLRIGLTGGDKLSEPVRRAWDECFGVPLLEGYGISETLGGVLINMLGDEDHAGNVGRAFPGIEVKIVADDGREVPDGTAGELWCKSDFVFSGYWKQPELTREVLVDGWYKTGDLAVRTSSGIYRILGRRDSLIMRATLNISPVELESVIQTHPAIKDCMVSGFPSEQLGQDVEAFLVFDGQLPLAEFKAYLMERLGAAFCPSRFWSIAEVPKTSMGKVDRRAAEQLRTQATLLES